MQGICFAGTLFDRLETGTNLFDRLETVLIVASKKVQFFEATPIGLIDEPKESLYRRGTDRDLSSA